MAGLPPDGTWLIQQIGGTVILFHRHTQEEIVRFDPYIPDDAARAQGTIFASDQLTTEQKSMASFWSGYFYAHATIERQFATVNKHPRDLPKED